MNDYDFCNFYQSNLKKKEKFISKLRVLYNKGKFKTKFQLKNS